jgi:hypothetical protein
MAEKNRHPETVSVYSRETARDFNAGIFSLERLTTLTRRVSEG